MTKANGSDDSFQVGKRLRVLVVVEGDDACHAILGTALRCGLELEARVVADLPGLCAALEDRPADFAIVDTTTAAVAAADPLAVIRHYDPDLPVVVIVARSGGGFSAVRFDAAMPDLFSPQSPQPLIDLLSPATLPRRLLGGRRALPVDAARVEVGNEAQAHFLQVAEHLPECFWLLDVASQRIVFVNAAFAQIWGLPIEALHADALAWLRLVPDDYAGKLREALDRARYGGLDEEFRIVRPDGGSRWVRLRTFPVRDAHGVARSVGGMTSDVTHLVEQNVELQRLTHYDTLTALPNRLLFHERLANAVALARRGDWGVAVLFIDLDRFKIVNDTLGHHIGDELLRLASLRLKACLRESDTVGRLGGDEFAVILADIESADVAAVVAAKIVAAMLQPFHVGDEELFISASIGITLYPEDAAEISELVRNADTAMYRAKEAGRSNYQFYTAELNQRARQRLSLENDLRRALARQEFELHYQPKVSCRDGRVRGVEALLRWRHPERGMVYPGDFVSLLEETGAIIDVGAWVLGEACRQTADWHRQGFATISVSVNISGRQLDSVGLTGAVGGALAASGLTPSALELELTESVLMRDAPAVISILQELKAMGVALSVDDFGTGYSSLAYLKRFPLDRLKVDRSFVQDITADPGDASITRAIITMAHELALEVVAEGVESEGQLRLLRAGHCDEIQGYFFSRPVPADELEALLRSGRRLDLDADDGRVDDGEADAAYRRALLQSIRHREQARDADRQRASWQGRSYVLCALLHELLERQSSPMLGIDEDGLLVFCNAAAERILGPEGALIGLEAELVLPENLLALVARAGVDAAVESDVECGQRQFRARAWSVGGDVLARGTIFVLDPMETA